MRMIVTIGGFVALPSGHMMAYLYVQYNSPKIFIFNQ